MNFKNTDHEAQYNQACKEVRVIRRDIMANCDENNQVIDQAIQDQLSQALDKAKAKKIKLTPKSSCRKSAMYLSAYA